MAYTAEEQKFYDWARGALPRFLFAKDRTEEEMSSFVKIFDQARQQIEAYFAQTLITQATGTGADYLNQHALDRDTARTDGETDVALRQRLRLVEDALIRSEIESAIEDVLAADGITADANVVEIRRFKGFFRDDAADTGTGGVFSGTPPNMLFEPDAGWSGGNLTPGLPYTGVSWSKDTWPVNWKLVLSGCASAGNDGTFVTTGFDDDAVTYANASGVAETDATCTWTIQKHDTDGNQIDSRMESYLSRGYRMTRATASGLIVILPYGTTAATALAVEEAVRQKKAAGFQLIVERRTSP